MPDSNTTTIQLTPLQIRVAREIVALVRRENFSQGLHLPEEWLAAQIGTSRSPIQAALRHLANLGVVRQDLNRGFFVAKNAEQWRDIAAAFATRPDDPLYLAIAEARQAKQLPDDVSETELMRQFGVARSTLRKVLTRISKEGWIEQRVGHGWSFLSLIDTPEAYEESYFFRQAIEPTGLLSPSFRPEPVVLDVLRKEQQFIVDNGFNSMTAIELFEANGRFHETLAQWSNNRFILQSVRQINQLRRLIEYRQAAQREARRAQALEHIKIIEAIECSDPLRAASLMRSHLDGARKNKVASSYAFTKRQAR